MLLSVFICMLSVLICISEVLHASAKLCNVRWRPDSVEKRWTKSLANSIRLILLYLQSRHIHQLCCIFRSNSCKQWKGEVTKRTLPESNAHMERLWFLAIYPNTNLQSAVEWINGAQQLTINAILPQNLLKFISRNSVICFIKIE